jgi:hypothetical protein
MEGKKFNEQLFPIPFFPFFSKEKNELCSEFFSPWQKDRIERKSKFLPFLLIIKVLD